MSTLHRFFTAREKGLVKKSSERSPTATVPTKTFHVAVQGCCHGELNRIYAACHDHEQQTGKKIDLLICCGDFQCVRNEADMKSMAVPDKYKTVGDFVLYYMDPSATAPQVTTNENASKQQRQGQSFRQYRQAPYLTIFIGGNHENSDWLAEESYGGFVAPNIYYLGHSGVIVVDGILCIAGLSGIFKDMDYHHSYPSRPYWSQESAKRSAYHVRRIEVEKLQAFISILRKERELRKNPPQNVMVQSKPQDADTTNVENNTSSGVNFAFTRSSYPLKVDVMLSHDWPAGITKYGDEAQLLRYKPYFKDEVMRNVLGNPHTLELLRLAQPQHWFAAHLHCFFQAKVPHRDNLSNGSGNVVFTNFTALDKCSKGKGFIDFFDISVSRVHDGGEGEVAWDASSPISSPYVEKLKTKSPDFAGKHRIQRHPLWVEVLKASHPHVSRNRCGSTSCRNPPGDPPTALDPSQSVFFDLNKFIEDWNHQEKNFKEHQEVESKNVETILGAPTTSALLSALHLHPAEPLQVHTVPGAFNPPFSTVTSAAMVMRGFKRERIESDAWDLNKADHAEVSMGNALTWDEDLCPS
ncbi:unnamed protein product [Phytomonas sp. Hart1]|nr:unnamed protein product [Phytomonas sp. Hart1]|eukprot:CCW70792.1 unnamed protein product [Phytomonas sp. isolate Hart1]